MKLDIRSKFNYVYKPGATYDTGATLELLHLTGLPDGLMTTITFKDGKLTYCWHNGNLRSSAFEIVAEIFNGHDFNGCEVPEEFSVQGILSLTADGLQRAKELCLREGKEDEMVILMLMLTPMEDVNKLFSFTALTTTKRVGKNSAEMNSLLVQNLSKLSEYGFRVPDHTPLQAVVSDGRINPVDGDVTATMVFDPTVVCENGEFGPQYTFTG